MNRNKRFNLRLVCVDMLLWFTKVATVCVRHAMHLKIAEACAGMQSIAGDCPAIWSVIRQSQSFQDISINRSVPIMDDQFCSVYSNIAEKRKIPALFVGFEGPPVTVESKRFCIDCANAQVLST